MGNIPNCLQGVSRCIFSVMTMIHLLSMSIFARHILVSGGLCPGTFVECRTGNGYNVVLTVWVKMQRNKKLLLSENVYYTLECAGSIFPATLS